MSDSLSEFESPKKKIRRETNSDENINVEENELCVTKHFEVKFLSIEQRNENFKNNNDRVERLKEILWEERDDKLSIISEEIEESMSSQEEQISYKLRKQMEMMRNDLKCGICGEEFHEAITLNCSHTFCKFCITMWKTKNMYCPICRTFIISECRSLVIDSFVENMLQTQPEDVIRERKERLKNREDHKLELARELSRVNVDDGQPDGTEPESNTLQIIPQDNTAPSSREDDAVALADATDANADNTQPTEDAVRATADTNNVTIWSSLRWLWQGRHQSP